MDINSGESYNFKVVLLGEGAVGKTSIVLRYIEDKFNNRHISTLQVIFNLVVVIKKLVLIVLSNFVN